MRWAHRLVAMFLSERPQGSRVVGSASSSGPAPKARRAGLAVMVLGSLVVACSDDDRPDAAGADPGAEPGVGEDQAVCPRDELRVLVDDYFDALAAHDPTTLPLAAELRSTENGEQVEPGEGFWLTAGATGFKRSAFDVERCGTHTQAVLEEDGVEVVVGVRLQLADDEITEIETYVTRDGDYMFFSPDGLVASDDEVTNVSWEELVPEESRATREELNDIADLYFDSFGPAGVVAPIQRDCSRWENGQRTADGDCTDGLPAPGQLPDGFFTGQRYPITDVEAGIAIVYVSFGDALDFHMFKIVDGEVRLIQAVVTAPGHDTTAWEDQEQP